MKDYRHAPENVSLSSDLATPRDVYEKPTLQSLPLEEVVRGGPAGSGDFASLPNQAP